MRNYPLSTDLFYHVLAENNKILTCQIMSYTRSHDMKK